MFDFLSTLGDIGSSIGNAALDFGGALYDVGSTGFDYLSSGIGDLADFVSPAQASDFVGPPVARGFLGDLGAIASPVTSAVSTVADFLGGGQQRIDPRTGKPLARNTGLQGFLDDISAIAGPVGQGLSLYGINQQQRAAAKPTRAEEILAAEQARFAGLPLPQASSFLSPESIQAYENAEMSTADRDFSKGLRMLAEENRRQAALGRTQFINPERRDETFNRLLMEYYPAAKQSARDKGYARATSDYQAARTQYDDERQRLGSIRTATAFLSEPELRRQALQGVQSQQFGTALRSLPGLLQGGYDARMY